MTPGGPTTPDSVLDVADLSVLLPSSQGALRIVDGVSLRIARGRTLCLVGESGCGKSLLALALMRLLPEGARTEGKVALGGLDLAGLGDEQVRALRGQRIGMVFQEPMTSLNPMFTVGFQVAEVLHTHHPRMPARDIRARVVAMFDRVRLPDAGRLYDRYPHELSGGMRQRVMIALALICSPELLIADEPSTALDVTVQAEILELLRELQRDLGMALMLITHDLGVVREMADEVAVMYAGRIAETAPVGQFFEDTQHPYALGLLASVPRLETRSARLTPIAGNVPGAGQFPDGCHFRTRCPFAQPDCRGNVPRLRAISATHHAACHFVPLEDNFR